VCQGQMASGGEQLMPKLSQVLIDHVGTVMFDPDGAKPNILDARLGSVTRRMLSITVLQACGTVVLRV